MSSTRVPAAGRWRRRTRLRRGALGALGLAPVCLLSWLLLVSPALAVDRVEVVGAARVPAAAVLAAAGPLEGQPLVRVDAAALRARVTALAAVGHVRVVRTWPSTLQVHVRERTPVATARQADGGLALLDATGTVFAPAGAEADGLPELKGPAELVTEAAVAVLAELPDDLRQQVATVQVSSIGSVSLGLRDARSVEWGRPGASARKTPVVRALLARPGRTIDVTVPGLAVVRGRE